VQRRVEQRRLSGRGRAELTAVSVHDREDVLGQLMRGSLDHCVKCTICETFCPVSNVTPLFPGPKYVGPQAERFRVNDEPSPDASLDYCSGCGICTMVCPHGVKIMEMNTRAREKLYGGDIPVRNRLLGRSELMGKLGHKFAPLVNFGMNFAPARIAAEKVMGVHRDAPLPVFHYLEASRNGVAPTATRRLRVPEIPRNLHVAAGE